MGGKGSKWMYREPRERPLGGQAVAGAGEPRRVRTACSQSAHLHISGGVRGAFSNESRGLKPVWDEVWDGYEGEVRIKCEWCGEIRVGEGVRWRVRMGIKRVSYL